ncbi:PorP/SprF family type IX secretion system membrane protein [Halocola ammonii]
MRLRTDHISTNFKSVVAGLVLAVLPFWGASQDPLFSQQGSTPLMINPALTGSGVQYRGIVNYRTQWRQLGAPFTTAAASFDMALQKSSRDRKSNKGRPAVGINFMTDRSGSPQLKHSSVNLNGAYQVYFNNRTTLGSGIYVGFNTMSLDEASGEWGSQYVNGQYNPDAPHGENLTNMQQSSIDVGGGLVFSKSDPGGRQSKTLRSYSVGAAFYHAGQIPLTDEVLFTDRKAIRWSGFAEFEFRIESLGGALKPSVYYNRQGPSQQILFGSFYKFTLVEGSSFQSISGQSISAGAFYRWDDAIIGKVLYETGSFGAGLAYDVNISGLKEYTNGRGAIEIMLSYKVGS